MITQNRIIAVSILIAIGFWIVDSIMDVRFFSGDSFLDELVLHPSAYEVYIRSMGTAFILIPGIILSRMYARQEAVKKSFSEKERHLREAQELGRIGSWEFDVQKQSIEWSDETYVLYERDKKLGPPSPADEAAYYTPEQASLLRDDGARAIETGQPVVRDVQVRLPSGKTAYYHTIMQPRQDGRGRTVKLSGVVQDITENTLLGAKLRNSEARYRRLFETAQDAILILNGDTGQIIDANPFIKDLLGYSIGELVGKNLWEIGELKDTLASKLSNQELHRNGCIRYDHLPLVAKDGRPIAVEVVANAYQVDGLRVIQCNIRDITERQKMTETLKAKDESLRLAQENAHIGNWDWDPLTGALYWSEENYRIFGLDPQKVAPSFEAFLAAVEPGDLETVQKAIADALADKAPYDIDMGIIRQDGARRTVNAKAKTIFDRSGKAMRMVGTVQDITDRKRAEIALRQSEETYKTLVEGTTDAVYLIDENNKILSVNASAARMLRKSTGEMVGKTLPDLFQNEFATTYAENVRRVFQSSAEYNADGDMTIDGKKLWINTSLSPVKNPAGEVIAVIGVTRDITERKMAEQYREMGREVLRILNEPVDLQSSVRMVLQTLKTSTGFDAVGIRLQHGDDFPYFVQQGCSVDHLLTEDTLVERDATGSICRGEDGKVSLECTCGLVVSGKTDPHNPLFTRGGSAWTNDSFPILDIPPGDDPRFHPRNRCIHQGYASVALVPIRTAERIVGLVQFNDRRKGCFNLDTIEILEGIASNIGTALMRKEAETAIKQSEMRYRSMFEQAADNVFMLEYGDDGVPVIADINASGLMAHGYSREEIIGKPITFINPGSTPEITAERTRTLASKGENIFPTTHRCKDGSLREFEVHANLLNIGSSKVVLTVAHDITGRKRAEEERQTFAKLESVGILAGGIAHDFNNLLTGILGNIQLAQIDSQPGSKVADRLHEAEKASLRARDLTQQLLTFSRGGAPVKKAIALGTLIKDSATFALRGSKVRCEFSLPADLYSAEADEGQISQVTGNLVINADQAMPEGGTIQIQARNLELEEGNTLSLPAGKYIQVSVEDHGIGIPEKYLNRIFEPYFTTKEKGHGLGLAAAYSIIKNHGGKITVDSRLGSGAIFRFYLPASKQPIQAGTGARKDIIPLRGRGRILVMDDEEVIRTLLNNMLNVTGYEAELAKDGDEAVELYRKAKERGRRFDAVIMDLTIPGGTGGKEAVQKVLEIDPAAKVIVSSGYANDPIMAEYQNYGFRGVIAKPFAMKRLTELLASLLTDKTR